MKKKSITDIAGWETSIKVYKNGEIVFNQDNKELKQERMIYLKKNETKVLLELIGHIKQDALDAIDGMESKK